MNWECLGQLFGIQFAGLMIYNKFFMKNTLLGLFLITFSTVFAQSDDNDIYYTTKDTIHRDNVPQDTAAAQAPEVVYNEFQDYYDTTPSHERVDRNRVIFNTLIDVGYFLPRILNFAFFIIDVSGPCNYSPVINRPDIRYRPR